MMEKKASLKMLIGVLVVSAFLLFFYEVFFVGKSDVLFRYVLLALVVVSGVLIAYYYKIAQ
jgi:hypothetical protein